MTTYSLDLGLAEIHGEVCIVLRDEIQGDLLKGVLCERDKNKNLYYEWEYTETDEILHCHVRKIKKRGKNRGGLYCNWLDRASRESMIVQMDHREGKPIYRRDPDPTREEIWWCKPDPLRGIAVQDTNFGNGWNNDYTVPGWRMWKDCKIEMNIQPNDIDDIDLILAWSYFEETGCGAPPKFPITIDHEPIEHVRDVRLPDGFMCAKYPTMESVPDHLIPISIDAVEAGYGGLGMDDLGNRRQWLVDNFGNGSLFNIENRVRTFSVEDGPDPEWFDPPMFRRVWPRPLQERLVIEWMGDRTLARLTFKESTPEYHHDFAKWIRRRKVG